jgi:hypothetical protein
MAYLGNLLSHRFNVAMLPVDKVKVGGKCGYAYTAVPEIAKYNKDIMESLSGFICSILHHHSVPLGIYKQFGDDNWKFSIYGLGKNKYVVSFQTLKLPPGIIDNSGNISNSDYDSD